VRISHDAGLDYMAALKFGETIDGQLDDETEEPVEGVYVFRRGPAGPVIGFGVENVSEVELPPDEPLLGRRYRFNAPSLGLRDASAEEVILATRAIFGGLSTPDVAFFDLAIDAGEEGNLEQAETYWRVCLASGDPKGHFGIGYTLCDLGRHREAYGHLRAYTGVVPRNAWAWSWLGQACEGIDEPREAARCYRRAIRLERLGSYETDARERMEELERRGVGSDKREG
jgi:tetratricopeptide (TPR) repeat protein